MSNGILVAVCWGTLLKAKRWHAGDLWVTSGLGKARLGLKAAFELDSSGASEELR